MSRFGRVVGVFAPVRRHAMWRLYLPAVIVLPVAALIVPGRFETVCIIIAGAASVAAILAGVRRHRPPHPSVWWLFGIGLLLFLFGDAVFAVYQQAGHDVPVPSAADAGYVLGYLAMILGLRALIQSRATELDRAALIDALVIAIGAGVLAWAFWLAGDAHDPSLSTIQKFVWIGYALLDITLLAGMVRLALGPGERALSYYLVAFSLLLLLVADLTFGQSAVSGDGPASLGDRLSAACYTLSYSLWGLAALHPSMRSMTKRAPPSDLALTRRRLATLATASIIAPVVLGLESITEARPDVLIYVAATIVSFLLVLSRMWGLMRLLGDVAATRALAMRRERTLRRAAARLLGAHDREAILDVACSAIAAVTDQPSGPPDVTAWVIANGSATATAGFLGLDARVPARIPHLSEALSTDLQAGRTVELTGQPLGIRIALGFPVEARTGIVVPVVIRDRVFAAFSVLSSAPLGFEPSRACLPSVIRWRSRLRPGSSPLTCTGVARSADSPR
jgi:hypothetical protein